MSERIRRLFTELLPFESGGRTAQHGASTKDDFRFLRAWWEVEPEKILTGTAKTTSKQFRKQTFEGKRWVPFAKGGEYSPYYADLYLVVNWEDNGGAIERYLLEKYPYLGGNANWVLHRECYYFQKGLTWPRRTNGLSFRVLPVGCIFADKGPSAFVPNGNQWALFALAALMNSQSFYLFVQMLVARVSLAQSFEVGLIQSIPIPDISDPEKIRLGKLANTCWDSKCFLDTANETSHVFYLPALLQVEANSVRQAHDRLVFAQSSTGQSQGSPLQESITAWQARVAKVEQQLAEYQREIDDIAFRLYGIEDEDRRAVEEVTSDEWQVTSEEENESGSVEENQETPSLIIADHSSLVTDLLSYTIGCIFGRWDVRFATGERQAPKLPDPFAPLPACSPGMLTGDDGLPLRETPPDYPLRIDWDGILVDDPDHQDDIVRHVREVLEVIWGGRAEAIEQEACEILGIKELRDYFRKPGNGGFWMDHVKRYSKSRRKAPIYWLLQSSKKNYALWLYYHRLDKDILFKALVNYVEPKLRLEENRLEQLRAQRAGAGTSGREAKQLEKQLDRQEGLLSELRDFHDKLRRAADLHLEPDLNDGVVLSIAPLWELVPWNDAKKYWDELLAGKYEWSSIGNQLRPKGLVGRG